MTKKTTKLDIEREFVTAEIICHLFMISDRTLREIKSKNFIEGVHYISTSQNLVRYNLKLVRHWFQTRHDPLLHAAYCQDYLESLKVRKRGKN